MTRVALYDHPAFREHDAGPGHPERRERLDAIRRGIREAGLEGQLTTLTPRPATSEELRRVHTEAHLARVAASRGRTVEFDPDTRAGPRSAEAALLAAGAVVDATERVLAANLDRAFCLVRPPGHHAEADRAMGFCLLNNVAVAAAHALAHGAGRVLIVDFDVHHGNGTQAIFYDDPRVLYVSSHLYPFYPGTGALSEVGSGRGRGFTVNLPLPPGTGDAEYAELYREIVEPIARAYRPDVVLVSCGFDPYRWDPLASMEMTERGFAELTASCLRMAAGPAGGRAVFALEGGYDLDGLAAVGAAVASVLLSSEVPPGPELEPGPAAESFARLLPVFRRELAAYWPVLCA